MAAYAFDEGSGATVADASGSGNNGTISGAKWSTSGKYGGALQFNGTNALVSIPDAASLHLSSAMTLEAWVDPSAVNSKWRDVIYKANDNLYLEATSTKSSHPDGGLIGGGSYADAFGTAALAANTWSFLAETYDGSTLRLYLNGTQVASTTHSGSVATSTNPLQIGGDSLYGQYFAGMIDNVRIYNTALSATQIQSDQSAPINAQSSPAPDTTPPTQPGTLSTNPVSSTEVDLSWGASTDNVGVTGYLIERCQDASCTNFTQIASVTATSTNYKDTSLSAGTSYSYRVRATDAAGNLSPYSNTSTATTAATASVPPSGSLHADATGRYLVSPNGTPILLTGDSPQGLIVNSGNVSGNPSTDATNYFSARKAEGFNAVWINLLCDTYTGGRSDGSTEDGIRPFTTGTSPSNYNDNTPNPAYFSRVDQLLQIANQYGFIVFLDPIETGGWLTTLEANGSGTSSNNYKYGQFLGSRYKSYTNIVWLNGNDYNDNSTDDNYVTAVSDGIRNTDPSALQTVEFNETGTPVSSFTDPTWRSRINLDGTYTYPSTPTYDTVLKDYNRSDHIPILLQEAFYENEHGISEHDLRAQEYWALLAGANAGQFYGEHYTSFFLTGWNNYLSGPNAQNASMMTYLVSLFTSREWYNLVPDQNHTVVTAGYGTYGQTNYVTAASTPDGKLAMAYVPGSTTLKVALGGFTGSVTARWYDPTNGSFKAIGGSPFANSGSVSLATPGANAAGDDDWVLVLEAS